RKHSFAELPKLEEVSEQDQSAILRLPQSAKALSLALEFLKGQSKKKSSASTESNLNYLISAWQGLFLEIESKALSAAEKDDTIAAIFYAAVVVSQFALTNKNHLVANEIKQFFLDNQEYVGDLQNINSIIFSQIEKLTELPDYGPLSSKENFKTTNLDVSKQQFIQEQTIEMAGEAIKHFGSGNYGSVCLVTLNNSQTQITQEVALKILYPDNLEDEAQIEFEYQREVFNHLLLNARIQFNHSFHFLNNLLEQEYSYQDASKYLIARLQDLQHLLKLHKKNGNTQAIKDELALLDKLSTVIDQYDTLSQLKQDSIWQAWVEVVPQTISENGLPEAKICLGYPVSYQGTIIHEDKLTKQQTKLNVSQVLAIALPPMASAKRYLRNLAKEEGHGRDEDIGKALQSMVDATLQLHQLGGAHRDNRTDNLLEKNGELILSDLGRDRQIGPVWLAQLKAKINDESRKEKLLRRMTQADIGPIRTMAPNEMLMKQSTPMTEIFQLYNSLLSALTLLAGIPDENVFLYTKNHFRHLPPKTRFEQIALETANFIATPEEPSIIWLRFNHLIDNLEHKKNLTDLQQQILSQAITLQESSRDFDATKDTYTDYLQQIDSLQVALNSGPFGNTQAVKENFSKTITADNSTTFKVVAPKNLSRSKLPAEETKSTFELSLLELRFWLGQFEGQRKPENLKQYLKKFNTVFNDPIVAITPEYQAVLFATILPAKDILPNKYFSMLLRKVTTAFPEVTSDWLIKQFKVEESNDEQLVGDLQKFLDARTKLVKANTSLIELQKSSKGFRFFFKTQSLADKITISQKEILLYSSAYRSSIKKIYQDANDLQRQS
ncbi:MAG: hypothetical protein AAGG80_07430, partial [Pseudomonadota bacterium]